MGNLHICQNKELYLKKGKEKRNWKEFGISSQKNLEFKCPDPHFYLTFKKFSSEKGGLIKE